MRRSARNQTRNDAKLVLLDYLIDITAELRRIARSQDLEPTTFLLSMACHDLVDQVTACEREDLEDPLSPELRTARQGGSR